jgi:hypothetical protein
MQDVTVSSSMSLVLDLDSTLTSDVVDAAEIRDWFKVVDNVW